MEAARKFLENFQPTKGMVLTQNIPSPKFGASDLIFVDKEKERIAIVMLLDGESYETFVVSALSYYFWLEESLSAIEGVFGGKKRVGMYLFCDYFSSAIRYMIEHVSGKSDILLVQYKVLQVEGLEEPVVHFHPIDFEIPSSDTQQTHKRQIQEDLPAEQEKGLSFDEISAQELKEFNRLKALYLD